ncbi:hypothetical protein R6Q57_025298 [Mikania cordata]
MGRAPCCSKVGLHRGAWSSDEDTLLINHIRAHGEGQWRSLPSKAGLLRCGKSCRLRWVNYLRPGIKRGNFTSEENDVIIRLHSQHGGRWSLIASELPGRTDNEIKNHWNAHLRKKPENDGNHHSKKIMKRKISDHRKTKTTSQQKSTEVKLVDTGSSSLSSVSTSNNESSQNGMASGASSSCTFDGDVDFDLSRLGSQVFLEVEDTCTIYGQLDNGFLMDGCDLDISKDDESLMFEKLYHEFLNLLDHQEVDENK